MRMASKKKPVNLYLDAELYDRFKKAVEAIDGTPSEFVNEQMEANVELFEALGSGSKAERATAFKGAFADTFTRSIIELGDSLRTISEYDGSGED